MGLSWIAPTPIHRAVGRHRIIFHKTPGQAAGSTALQRYLRARTVVTSAGRGPRRAAGLRYAHPRLCAEAAPSRASITCRAAPHSRRGQRQPVHKGSKLRPARRSRYSQYCFPLNAKHLPPAAAREGAECVGSWPIAAFGLRAGSARFSQSPPELRKKPLLHSMWTQ